MKNEQTPLENRAPVPGMSIELYGPPRVPVAPTSHAIAERMMRDRERRGIRKGIVYGAGGVAVGLTFAGIGLAFAQVGEKPAPDSAGEVCLYGDSMMNRGQPVDIVIASGFTVTSAWSSDNISFDELGNVIENELSKDSTGCQVIMLAAGTDVAQSKTGDPTQSQTSVDNLIRRIWARNGPGAGSFGFDEGVDPLIGFIPPFAPPNATEAQKAYIAQTVSTLNQIAAIPGHGLRLFDGSMNGNYSDGLHPDDIIAWNGILANATWEMFEPLPSNVPPEVRDAALYAARKNRVSPIAITAIFWAENGGLACVDCDPNAPQNPYVVPGDETTGYRGPMQFGYSEWITHGQDCDGDGKANIWSMRDAFCGTASYLKGLGYKPGIQIGDIDLTLNGQPGTDLTKASTKPSGVFTMARLGVSYNAGPNSHYTPSEIQLEKYYEPKKYLLATTYFMAAAYAGDQPEWQLIDWRDKYPALAGRPETTPPPTAATPETSVPAAPTDTTISANPPEAAQPPAETATSPDTNQPAPNILIIGGKMTLEADHADKDGKTNERGKVGYMSRTFDLPQYHLQDYTFGATNRSLGNDTVKPVGSGLNQSSASINKPSTKDLRLPQSVMEMFNDPQVVGLIKNGNIQSVVIDVPSYCDCFSAETVRKIVTESKKGKVDVSPYLTEDELNKGALKTAEQYLQIVDTVRKLNPNMPIGIIQSPDLSVVGTSAYLPQSSVGDFNKRVDTLLSSSQALADRRAAAPIIIANNDVLSQGAYPDLVPATLKRTDKGGYDEKTLKEYASLNAVMANALLHAAGVRE